MRVRSITYFCDPRYPLRSEVLHEAGRALRAVRGALEVAGYEVQTTRLATIPFPQLLRGTAVDGLPHVAQELELILGQIGVEHASLGPALPGAGRSYELIPDAVSATRNIFFGGALTEKRTGAIDLDAVRRCAQIIRRCASLEANGFANLRFAALANVPAGSPFFPAAYHAGGRAAIAIATEAADLAVDAFEHASTVADGQAALSASVRKHATALTRAVRAAEGGAKRGSGPTGLGNARFAGIDFSLAPFPKQAISLGNAFERMGVPRAGLHGSLAAAAVLTDAVDRVPFRRTGFSGLMLPVLEDAVLAQRAADGTLTMKDLLMYSAVCGTGLDTVPLPGDASEGQIAAALLDLAALALRLDKPLTARLMPIPNKKAGDATGFDFAFFANSKVMRLEAEDLDRAWARGGTVRISARRAASR